MSRAKRQFGWLMSALLLFLSACAPSPPSPQQTAALERAEATPAPEQLQVSPAPMQAAALEKAQLPVRFQRPNYLVKEPLPAAAMDQQQEEFTIQVGADISSTTGPVPLRDILKRLANLKGMNISWSSDVDQFTMVDVDIRAEDDFFKSIENLLRQVDYFHEAQGNTVVVKYKETRRFHIAMPFTTSTYTTGVGGNVLGSTVEEANISGTIKLDSENNTFDIWDNIKTNLDQILEIWSEPTPASPAPATAEGQPAPQTRPRSGKGYYSIDRPIGLITVTAPRPLLEKVANYLDNLKKELYRQISIEAKILEVTLEDSSTKGINWADVISNVRLDFQVFGPQGIIYSPTESFRAISQVSTPNNPFSLVLDAIEQQGRLKVLANPRISVMNGQPALISVGENVRFIDKIEASTTEGGGTTFSATTSSIMSGLGLSVVATVLDENEIILSLTPVTSQLQEPIQQVQIGDGTIMLPTVRLREMNTLVRIKDGGMLVVGGLIDESDSTEDTKVPVLGDLPVVNKLFKSESKNKTKTELIILLRPQILS